MFSSSTRWRCAGQTMALFWSLLLAFLFAIMALSHGSEPGAPHGKRRKAQTSAGGSNGLHYPPQGPQSHGYSRDRGGHANQRSHSAKNGAGLLSHRAVHPLARPEDDGTGLEGLSPVRVEMGPGRDRDSFRMSLKSSSQARENQLLGTRKGRGNGHGNGFGQHLEHRRQGSRRDKGRHRKGEFWTHAPAVPSKNPFSTAVVSSTRSCSLCSSLQSGIMTYWMLKLKKKPL